MWIHTCMGSDIETKRSTSTCQQSKLDKLPATATQFEYIILFLVVTQFVSFEVSTLQRESFLLDLNL